MRIEKIDAIRQDMAFPQKEEAMSVLNKIDVEDSPGQNDTVQIDMSFYVERAKLCRIDKEALEILLRIELGGDADIVREIIN